MELAEAYLQRASLRPEHEYKRLALINQAIDQLRKLVQRNPGNAQVRSRLAFALNDAGMSQHTRGEFEKADALYIEARSVIESVLCDDPGNLEARHLLAIILRDTANSYSVGRAAEKGSVMRLGKRREGGELYYRQCLELGRQLVNSAPGNQRYRVTLAANLMNAVRFMSPRQALPLLKEAVEQFEIACQQNPDRVDYQRKRAKANKRLYQVLFTMERYEESIDVIQRVIAIDEAYPVPASRPWEEKFDLWYDLEDLSISLEKTERWRECRQTTERLIKTMRETMAEDRFVYCPGILEDYDRLGAACRALGDEHSAREASVNRSKVAEEMIERVTRNIDEKKGQPGFFEWQRGWLYNKLDRVNEAIADYTRVIELIPNHQSAVMNRARLYREKGQYDLVLAEMTRAVGLWPHSSICWGNRAGIGGAGTMRRRGERCHESLGNPRLRSFCLCVASPNVSVARPVSRSVGRL